ncbi:MAG: type II toxin-antitoxin system TacA family antitoxin [Gemmatimonadaceae bacterium]
MLPARRINPRSDRPGRDERLTARIPSEEKSLLQRAAERRGQTLSAYVLEKARVAAVADLEEAGEAVLATKDRQLFVNLLVDPPKANARLRAAIKSAEALASRE